MINEQRICQQCKSPYEVKADHQKFCSTKCRKYHWLEKKGFKDISFLIKRMDGLENKIKDIENKKG